MKKEQEFIELTSYWDNNLAQLLKVFLEDKGLFCWIKNEFSMTIVPAYGGYKIMVTSEQFEECKGALNEFEKNINSESQEGEISSEK